MLAVQNAKKAKLKGVRHFIQMSTIAVYGKVSKISISTFEKPIDQYGNSKLKADKEILALSDNLFKVTIIRPPMVYGGGNSPGNLMRLIEIVDSPFPLPFKKVKNLRDFINIRNLVQYISIIIESELYGIMIVSDQRPVSTEYLVECISENLRKRVLNFKLPEHLLYLFKLIKPDLYEKLYGNLIIESNFPLNKSIFKFSIEEGIKEMVQWHRSRKY